MTVDLNQTYLRLLCQLLDITLCGATTEKFDLSSEVKTWKKNIKPLLGKYCTLRLCKGFPVSLRRCLSSVEPQILGRRISVHACIVYACSLARFLCLFFCFCFCFVFCFLMEM